GSPRHHALRPLPSRHRPLTIDRPGRAADDDLLSLAPDHRPRERRYFVSEHAAAAHRNAHPPTAVSRECNGPPSVRNAVAETRYTPPRAWLKKPWTSATFRSATRTRCSSSM